MSTRSDLCRGHVMGLPEEVRSLGHITINGADIDLDAPETPGGAGAPPTPHLPDPSEQQ